MEDLSIDNGDVLTRVVSTVLNLAMRLEQGKALQAAPYERSKCSLLITISHYAQDGESKTKHIWDIPKYRRC